MADQSTTDTNDIEVPTPTVIAPANALIGDENAPEVREVEVHVVDESVPAQVTGPPSEVVDTVRVHETSVSLDEVITDPSSPLAVQVPDAGRGDLSLPIHALAGQTPEQVFASEATETRERTEDEADSGTS